MDKAKQRYQAKKLQARAQGVEFDLNIPFVRILLESPCAYCGLGDEKMTIDRVKPGLAYTVDNVVACCRVCNSIKGNTRTPEDMARFWETHDRTAYGEKKNYIIRLPKNVYEIAKRLADADHRTVPNQIAWMIMSADGGTPTETPIPQKITEVETFRGQAAVNDLLKDEDLEHPCCKSNARCKHWQWDINTGEGYINSLSGRVK